MPRFKVSITGEGLEQALATLNGASIPTLGPAFTWFGEPTQGVKVGKRMTAVVDAETAEEAESHVRENLPGDGDYVVEPAEPFKQRD